MSNSITEIHVNIHDGILDAVLHFDKGLNIISGENGTLKTQLLIAIRFAGTNSYRTDRFITETGEHPRFMTINPKRHLIRYSVEDLRNQLRQPNRALDTMLGSRQAEPMQDRIPDSFPSMGELYYAAWEKRCLDGGNRIERMEAVTSDFNTVIEAVFPDYSLQANWDSDRGIPKVMLRKRDNQTVPLEGLSLGEQDVLSLIMYLVLSRDTYDVCLIDEPEIHLNWHLEDGLFRYLKSFCDTYEKQVIAVTHSRAIFREPFLDSTQFLVWNEEGKIEVQRELRDEQLAKLVGEAVQIIRLADFSQPTFFVEDDEHENVIEALARALDARVSVVQCGNSANVVSFYQTAKKFGGWRHAIFVRDGDNQGNRFPRDAKFIHLERYCMENYFLDYTVLSRLTGKSEAELKGVLLGIVKAKKKEFTKSRSHELQIEQLTVETFTDELLATLDASKLLHDFLRELGIPQATYIESYINTCFASQDLKRVFPEVLINNIEKG